MLKTIWKRAVDMRLRLTAVGTKMPAWLNSGFRDYADRMPRECALQLVEVSLPKRGKRPHLGKLLEQEAERLLKAAGGARIVALDERGRQPDTAEFARWLEGWLGGRRDVAFLVGGPDGLAARCMESAERVWSLSRLTLPHALVRVLVAEQCYRAVSLLRGHPYHRQ